MKKKLPARYMELKNYVDVANILHQRKSNERKLSLGLSQVNTYTLHLIRSKDDLVLGTVCFGNFNDIKKAINVFCRTLQLI